MIRRAAKFLAVLIALEVAAGAGGAFAQPSTTPGVEGHWQGEIEVPGKPLAIDVDLARSEAGALRGDISIPIQGIADLDLEEVTLAGDAIGFRIPGIPGEPTFAGVVEDGVITGSFTQGGAELGFRLSRGASPADSARLALDGFTDFVAAAIGDWNVPGLALAVVRGGEVVLAEGFGRRDVANDLPMTADTLQPIGSTTKAFTTTLLGTLVDSGDLEWDAPLTRFLPGFRLRDPMTTQLMTPRDLVTHRSGLPRHDLLWYNETEATRAELVAALAHLEASAGLRERYQYNNLMFLTAGHLVERLTGDSWEAAVRERLLDPLGMRRTTPSLDDLLVDPDHARPYREEDGGELVEIPYRRIDLMGPAGSLISSASEMSRWLLFNLAGGMVGDERLVNASTLADLQTPRMPTGVAPEHRQISSGAYALGWRVDTYRGHRRVAHGGAIDGFVASVALFPDDDLGIVALANVGTGLPGILVRHAADRVLGLEPIDWNAEGLAERAAGKAAQEQGEAAKASLRKEGTSPSHPLADYAGGYEHRGYGVLSVGRDGDALSIAYNGIEAPLEHWHYDIWRGADNEDDPTFENMPFQFVTGLNGDIAAVEAPFEPTVDPIRFDRRPDARLSDPGFLRRLTGTYVLEPQTIEVTLSGSTLTLTITGQPAYSLVPVVGGRFALAQVPVVEVGFSVGESGPATAVTFYQPNGVFTAERAAESP